MVFTWECDGNTFEEKGMIEDSLPEGFTYKIAKCKVIERSEIKEDIKFRADFSVSVSDKEEAIIYGFSLLAKEKIVPFFSCSSLYFWQNPLLMISAVIRPYLACLVMEL